MRQLRYLLLSVGLPLLVGCEDPLTVVNKNSPDRERVLSQPADLQQFIVNSWASYHDAINGATGSLQPQLQTSALENFSELANFGMNLRVAIPRSFIDNQRGNAAGGGNYRDFLRLSRAARSSALGLAALNTPGFTIGSAAADARARTFAQFVLGASLATLALSYDSVAIIAPDDDPEGVPPLSGYTAASVTGLARLDSAIILAQASPAGTFPLPASFLNTPSTVSQADFIRVVRSYRARLRAAVARNPTDRANVDWAAVIADANAGITADFQLQMNPSLGWTMAWLGQHYVPGLWHSTHQFMVGFADTSGNFDAWLVLPRLQRQSFLIHTPDRRWPRGATRTAQQSSPATAVLPAGQYFRNRPPGDDTEGDPLGNSQYDHYRWRAFYNASRIGPHPVITKAEMDLLAAEGYIRANPPDFTNAMLKINPTRTAAGLASLVGITALTQAIPGGASCVPRVPQPPNFTSTACGTILEAMKWEKRTETMYTGYGQWYFDSRGWGDLPEGTPVMWPVPWQEMDTRRQLFYALGGCGNSASAGLSTYGLSC